MLSGYERDKPIPGYPTKVFWSQGIKWSILALGERVHPAEIVGGERAHMTGIIPWNYHGFKTFDIHIVPFGTLAYNIALSMWASQCGENAGIHAQAWAGVEGMVLNIKYCLDVLTRLPTIIAALTPGDSWELQIVNNTGTTIRIYGAHGRYI